MTPRFVDRWYVSALNETPVYRHADLSCGDHTLQQLT